MIKIYLKGMFIGAADVVPGISGGTIALVTHVYYNFIKSLSHILQTKTLKLLISFKFKEIYQHLNGQFFLPLVLGILTSIFLFSHVISYIYQHYPILLWSFFLGLVLMATFFLIKEIKNWNLKYFFLLIVGITIAWLATGKISFRFDDSLFSVFIAGIIAVAAMLLPGISGSFLLILMGKYQLMLEATKNLDLTIIFTFGVGCITSLILFSKLLNWLIKNYWNSSLSLMIGFLIGSAHRLWPWRETISTYISNSGVEKPLIQRNISPWLYELTQKSDNQVIGAIICLGLGVIIIIGLERIKKKA